MMDYLLLDRICTMAGSHLHRARVAPDGAPTLLKLVDAGDAVPGQMARFRHEYELLRTLEIAGVVKAGALVDEPGWLAMVVGESVGEPLETLLRRTRPDVPTCLRLACQLADIVAGLQASHVIHQDIRPANFMLTAQARLCLLDVSLALSERQPNAAGAAPIGDWAYVSPEQTGRLGRALDYRTDFYSLGVMLYRLLTGQLPFVADDPLEWAHCHIARTPPAPSSIIPALPPPVSDIVMKLLAKLPEDRYQSAHGLRHDLQRCLAQWQATGQIEPFPVGQEDYSDRFQIPHKLYGREQEVASLLAAFERMATTGLRTLVTVAGPAGVGKSSVVDAMRQSIVERHGYFIVGKFDQYQRDIPYATVTQAFQELVRQLLAESEARIADWRQRIEAAVGANGQLIIAVLPQVELIIGQQPPVPDLAPIEAQNRFRRVFRQFLDVFTQQAHPLVLFLDDVQWIDADSLDLIRLLLTDADSRYLVLIAAYRDNEVGATHPLAPVLEKIRRSDAATIDIGVAPLAVAPLNQLVAELLHVAPASCEPLTRRIVAKTEGNPFFFTQFLGTLHREGLLRHDAQARRWQWDLEQIRARDFADNVADLMVNKLQRLPPIAQQALQLAACLGNRFDLHRLALVLGTTKEQVEQRLWAALDEGLILRAEHTGKFLHDRIQQAAYSLIAPDQRGAIHLRIGQVLLANLGADALAAQVFDVANQFHLGAALLVDPHEKEQVAALNLRAGRKAKASAAYTSACAYLAAGMALLEESDWDRHYELIFNLWLERANCELLAGRLDEAARCIEVLLQRGQSHVDLAAAYNLKILLHVLKSENLPAIDAGRACLRLFGIDIPACPTDEHARAEYEAIWRQVGDRPVESLIDLPLLTDRDMQAAMNVLSDIVPPAYFIDVNLARVLFYRLVNLSLKHGVSGAFAFGLATFGSTLGTDCHSHRTGYRFAQLAVDLVEKHGFLAYTARVYLLTGYAAVWVQPLSTALDYNERGFRIANDTGDVTDACYMSVVRVVNTLTRGDPLDAVWRDAEKAVDFVRKSGAGYRDAMDMVISHQRFILAMQGRTAALSSFSDAQFHETDFEGKMPPNRMPQMMGIYWTLKLQAQFLSGDYAGALAVADKAKPLLWALYDKIPMFHYHYYTALAMTAIYETGAPDEQRAWRERLGRRQQRLREWMEGYPPTFQDKHALLAAEIARIDGRELDALRLYQQAIASARDNGFVHNEGIAHELAASFCRAHGFTTAGNAHLAEARNCFARWGAAGKVAQLEARYPQLRAQPALPSTMPMGNGMAQLDLRSIAKASQAISGRIVLSELVDTLMRTMLENAGAQSGALLLVRNDQLMLAADARIDGQTAQVEWHFGQPGLPTASLPVSILNYVRRSREQVLLADVAEPNPFAADPYLARRQPKSVLCLPILRQDALLAMLYLEHGLVTHAFTPARLTVLQVLAAQAAISLENALLYADLQDREARIRRLIESNIIGVFFWDMEGNVRDANDAFLQLVGYSRQDMLSGHVRWPDITPPAHRDLDTRMIDELKQAGSIRQYEKEFIRKDGRLVPVLIGAALLEGSQVQGVAFVLDLTEQKQAEERAFAARIEVEQQKTLAGAEAQANQAKRVFLANMSHELRSPLNVVLGFCQLLLRDTGLPHTAREDLRTIYKSGQHLYALINQVLDLSKIEAGRITLNEIDFDLYALLDELAGMFGTTANQKGLTLVVDSAPEVPQYLHADALKLRQVLINLMNNAIKFTREGGVAVNVRVRQSDPAQSGMLSFTVSDTGPGIAPGELGQLGSAFVQAQAGQQAREGTGLGLAISRSFVQLMGGELKLSSRLGEGSTIAFDIVVQPAQAAQAAAIGAARRAVAVAAGQPAYRVLAVDDRLESRQLLVRVLAPLGFAVREAGQGEEAIAIWQEWQPHLILTDIRMPVMDGRQMTRHIKATAAGKATTIIAVTASSFEEDKEAILAAGCDDFLRKPFRHEVLLDMLHRHLGVEFIYEDEPAEPAPPAVDPAALAALPAELRARLQQALTQLDVDAVQGMIDTIRSHDAALADALGAMAGLYEYDKILALLPKQAIAREQVG
jgi:PAS domain S-box-containing protein